MIQRCTNPKNHAFRDYGGRGITVSPLWKGRGGFARFLAHTGERPDGCTLDRIDNSRGYEPGNVRWATLSQQQNNRRDVLKITIGSETRSLTEWCRANGVNRCTAFDRIERGWPHALAVTEPPNKARRLHDKYPELMEKPHAA